MRLTRGALVLSALLWMSSSASAAPIAIAGTGGLASFEFLTDDPAVFRLVLSGGAVTASPPFVNNFKPPSGFWDITLDISIQNAAADRVVIFGEVFHRRHPPGDPLAPGGPGGTFGFSFIFSPPAAAAALPGPAVRRHGGHRDRYFNLQATQTVGAGNQLLGWSGEITGRHERAAAIPEPATLLLLGTGLAGIGMKLRKRRQAKDQ